jgi:hypothetical protein
MPAKGFLKLNCLPFWVSPNATFWVALSHGAFEILEQESDIVF